MCGRPVFNSFFCFHPHPHPNSMSAGLARRRSHSCTPSEPSGFFSRSPHDAPPRSHSDVLSLPNGPRSLLSSHPLSSLPVNGPYSPTTTHSPTSSVVSLPQPTGANDTPLRQPVSSYRSESTGTERSVIIQIPYLTAEVRNAGPQGQDHLDTRPCIRPTCREVCKILGVLGGIGGFVTLVVMLIVKQLDH